MSVKALNPTNIRSWYTLLIELNISSFAPVLISKSDFSCIAHAGLTFKVLMSACERQSAVSACEHPERAVSVP